MRAVGLIAAAAVVAVAFLFPAGAGGVAAKPSLTILDQTPVAVQGLGFKPREPIRLRLVAPDTTREKWFRAGPRGGFTVRFLEVAMVDRCSGSLLVTALGPNGLRAYAKKPQVLCPPRLRLPPLLP